MEIDEDSNQCQIKLSEEIQNHKAKSEKFEYKSVASWKIIFQNERFYSFSFNQNTTIFFVGSHKGNIKLYGFNNIKKLIQILTYHTKEVGCIIFMKKSKSIISGSNDKSIAIWNQNQNNLWKPQQTLLGHTHWINCMITNKDENILISGGGDEKIKFWKKSSITWVCQQTIQTQFDVYCLSLNDSETKLISCGYENNIKVIEQDSSKLWNITQIIKVDEWGLRLHFINDNIFVFQPFKKGFLEIYNYERQKNQFVQVSKIQVQACNNCYCYFPCQFIEQKKMLSIKHGKHINFIRLEQNGQILRQQSIEFNHPALYGKVSNDGQFIMSWNRFSLEILIRKIKHI